MIDSTVQRECERGEAPGASLDRATLTVGDWLVSAYPEAGETTITWSGPRRPGRLCESCGVMFSGDECGRCTGATVTDPERSAREAARRAGTTLRRYAVAHLLDRQMSLTYRDEDLPDDIDGVWAHVESFRRRLFAYIGERIPLVFVIERGEESGRLHVHGLVGRFIDQRALTRLWGHGHSWIDRIQGMPGMTKNTLRTVSKRERCRINAAYVSSYVKKGFERDHERNRKRYSTTKGMVPRRVQMRAVRWPAAVDVALETAGAPISYWWSSSSVEGWKGPPVWVGYFGDPDA